MSARRDLTPHGKTRACWIAGERCDSLREGVEELRKRVHLTRPEVKIEYHTLINALRFKKASIYGVPISSEPAIVRPAANLDAEERTTKHKPGRDPLLPGACSHRLGYNPSRFE